MFFVEREFVFGRKSSADRDRESSSPSLTTTTTNTTTMSTTPSPHSQENSQRRKLRRVRHQKSRHGCYTCKQRRVKCDEQQPVCGACAFRGEPCTFPPVFIPQQPAPALETALPGLSTTAPLASQPLNMTDMSLLIFFIKQTSNQNSLQPARRRVWQHIVPEMAAQEEYLMHLVLALAGEHALYEAVSAPPAVPHLSYHRVIEHYQKGLEGFRDALSRATSATAEYVFCGAAILVAIAFASLSMRKEEIATPALAGDSESASQLPNINWMYLVRGLTGVIGDHWHTLRTGRLRCLLTYMYAAENTQLLPGLPSPPYHFPRLAVMKPPHVFSIFAQGAMHAIHSLRAFAATLSFPAPDSSPSTPSNDPPYDHLNSINIIEKIYTRILSIFQLSPSERADTCSPSMDLQIDLEESALTSWPHLVSDVFLAGLRLDPGQQIGIAEAFSYTLVAHFYITGLLVQDVWYYDRGFREEIARIEMLVASSGNSDLQALMEWPKAVVDVGKVGD
ncbi:hypothetical protein BJY04DRAFT_223366 [Aspergillus karnatakaensis]|uniref:Zn(II)2Cys6 transcription factor n=1 Tax=Aspergillus karnatakaensis TaxID=1810916 RepID=UPI003CCCED7D